MSIQLEIYRKRAGLIKENTEVLNEEFTSLIEESYEYDSADVDFVFEIMEDIENIMEALPKAAYVSAMRTTSDPEYQGKLDRDDVVARAKKYHGDKFASQLQKGADKMHFPRAHHSFSAGDPLKGMSRSSSPSHTTKAGKLTKASVKGLKSTIKSRMSSIKEEDDHNDHQEHWDNGYKHGRESANDAGFKDTARSRKKEMLADNPHKKGTPQHKAWHAGANEGHQDALDLDM